MAQAVPLSADQDRMRVIMCLRFDRRAPPEKIKEFKRSIMDCPLVLHTVEVSGTFDFIFEAAVVDLACYHQKLEGIAAPLRDLVERYETNFVCGRHDKPAPGEHQLPEQRGTEIWVPCRDGRRRVQPCDISRITAERDYVRIRAGGSDYLLHCTIKQMLQRLDHGEFIHIHRSVIIRRGCVERLIHEDRHWKVRLDDGSTWPISKSHEREVVRTFAGIQSQPNIAKSREVSSAVAARPHANLSV